MPYNGIHGLEKSEERPKLIRLLCLPISVGLNLSNGAAL